MKPKTLAVIIGIVGLIVMFFFPSPEENFLYYVGFVAVIAIAIVAVLKSKLRGKKKKK